MAKNFVVQLNLESAMVDSQEPMVIEDPELENLADLTAEDPPAFAFLRALVGQAQSEFTSETLPRLIRELGALLTTSLRRTDVHLETQRLLGLLVEKCAWAIEKGESLCVWEAAG